MSDQNDQDAGKSRLSLRPAGGRLELGKTVDAGSVRQSFSHGRSKTVQVEVVKKRTGAPAPRQAAGPAAPVPAGGGPRPAQPRAGGPQARGPQPAAGTRPLTAAEQAVRQRVLEEQRRLEAQRQREERERQALMVRSAAEEARRREEEEKREAEEAARRAEEEAARAKQEAEEAALRAAEEAEQAQVTARQVPAAAPAPAPAEARTPAQPAAPARPAPVRPVAPPLRTPGRPGPIPVGPGAQRPRPGGPAQPQAPAAQAAAAPGAAATPAAAAARLSLRPRTAEEEDEARRTAARRPGLPAAAPKKPALAPARKGLPGPDRRGGGRIDVQAAIEGEDERSRSIASLRRARERERRQQELARLRSGTERVVRDVVVPEAITVQELANRMAARGGEVVKALFRMGVMATLTQTIDADTAELVVQEFGHRVRRVSESDVELGLEGVADEDTDLQTRPPVVTIMGHVDHGKTSLLDALRKADVAAHEAGGITQHIGAYQVQTPDGGKVTFIDTPGHAAFTAMRSRGAQVTDMVVLVVAADDGVMPQTVEAISHAKAANVPIIVAVNKIDKPGVRPERVKQELLQHDIVVESLGGETQEVEVSATQKINLDKLLEAIQLQAEILDLKANPSRAAEGTVIESKLDRGRGPVATVLVQKGTLHQGDIVVAGTEWGRVRAMLDDKGRQLKEAPPSLPVEILGLSGVPAAGENFVAVEDEARAREISDFRQRKAREKQAATAMAGRGTLTDMLARIQAGEQKEVAVVVKADVQGSAEAIGVVLGKLGNEEVRVRVLHSAVGQITESDIQLAKASNAVLVAFNVRATSQARELAQREGVDIRYYSIIYEVSDDIEKMFKSKLAPVARENFLGYAQILQVFEVKRVGNVAGCRVTEGVVKRGCGVRLIRDGVVIHQGELSTLRRFKDDVKEVTNGYECGMSFANYNDIRVGDQIECYETEMVSAA
ncbi:translation initiation factor IF-2 [Paracraurococcus lichenis]|uniref:Translation initiation factor IF-2 n=1 Tax=Paracraurococcus lichenis TaxID=3064888 RepID=A0ABT9E372_9PROT|nr:translation initiation factor IF-2 [Paracraurococcus sp. LOR1-02]MDO9710598.1 translation initiation factor IF-2 [Paracraurococcus sp. LOR1-02]